MIRNNQDIVYGKTKPTVDIKGLRHYQNDYNPIFEYWEQIQKKRVIIPLKISSRPITGSVTKIVPIKTQIHKSIGAEPGLEPGTPSPPDSYANHLRYYPTKKTTL